MAKKTISMIIGKIKYDLPIAKTNNAFFQQVFAKRPPLSPEQLYSQIDPNDPDDYDFSTFTPLADLGYIYTPKKKACGAVQRYNIHNPDNFVSQSVQTSLYEDSSRLHSDANVASFNAAPPPIPPSINSAYAAHPEIPQAPARPTVSVPEPLAESKPVSSVPKFDVDSVVFDILKANSLKEAKSPDLVINSDPIEKK